MYDPTASSRGGPHAKGEHNDVNLATALSELKVSTVLSMAFNTIYLFAVHNGLPSRGTDAYRSAAEAGAPPSQEGGLTHPNPTWFSWR